MGNKFGENSVAKLGFAGFALAGCLALTSCVTSPRIQMASAFKYPEAQTYLDCAVEHARKRAFDDPKWFKTDDIHVPIHAGESDCEAEELLLQMRARADGVPAFKFDDFEWKLRTKIWDRAGDEIIRVREERLKAMGVPR
ncbi:hypothetical protein [Pleomorphomonas oryzae]|uniref:hypothetical protein n=1 Tax=Pleomorphomonas oryzae TaxID=261934 RepID=UPI0012EC14BD|nr:hypothetical protein [Pleomorphomonas oryzae]